MGMTHYIVDDKGNKKGFASFAYGSGNLERIEIWEELNKEEMKLLGKFLIQQSKINKS